MTTKSTADWEREAEAARRRVTETAETLQSKVKPSRLLDELGHYLKNSDGAVALDNLKSQVRDNPLPLALVGLGLTWLFMGGGPSSSRIAAKTRGADGHDSQMGSDDIWSGAPGMREPLVETMPKDATSDTGGVTKSAAQARDSLSKTMGSAYASAGRNLSSAAGSVSENAQWASRKTVAAGHNASAQARHAGNRMSSILWDTIENEPFVLGAFGVAVGAAVGAMLPSSRLEEEYIGPYREKAQESVKGAIDRGIESAKDVASEAYHAGAEEAKKQSHSSDEPHGGTKEAPKATAARSTTASAKTDVGERKDKAK